MNQTDGPWPSPLVRMRGKTFNSLIKEDGISNYQLFFLCARDDVRYIGIPISDRCLLHQ
jgi:hypothetical protein